MASATKSTAVARKTAAKSKVAAAKGKARTKTAATKPAADGPSKRELAKVRDAELTDLIVAAREGETPEKWGEIAAEHSITPGKAQFLYMQYQVAEGDVPAIRHRNENELVAGIRKAREANNSYSSWGWIAARTGVSEGKVKALAEEAGIPVSGTNVAVARAEANGTAKKADTKTRKQASTTTASKAAKAKAAAKSRRAAKGKTDPS